MPPLAQSSSGMTLREMPLPQPQRPPRTSLINLASGERWDAPFNPASLAESIAATYARHQIPGLSHQRLQYIGTENKKYRLEFFLSQLRNDEQYPDLRSILTDKQWLESLLFPVEVLDNGHVGSPRVLFVWPGVARMQGRVTAIEFEHRAFSVQTLRTTVMMASVQLESDRDIRVLSMDVRRQGEQHYREVEKALEVTL